jgi:hypothetical protein
VIRMPFAGKVQGSMLAKREKKANLLREIMQKSLLDFFD